MKTIHQDSQQVSISAVNWGEIVYVLLRARGQDEAREICDSVSSLPIRVVEVTAEGAEHAASIKEQFKILYADAFAAALAFAESATLLTADYDFKNLDNGFRVKMLPAKAGSAHQ